LGSWDDGGGNIGAGGSGFGDVRLSEARDVQEDAGDDEPLMI